MKLNQIAFFFVAFLGIVVAMLGIANGGGGDENSFSSLAIFVTGTAMLAISTVFMKDRIYQILTGLGMLLYGIWWVVLPEIETAPNLMTACLIVVGSLLLCTGVLSLPANERKRAKKYVLIFLLVLVILAVFTLYYCRDVL